MFANCFPHCGHAGTGCFAESGLQTPSGTESGSEGRDVVGEEAVSSHFSAVWSIPGRGKKVVHAVDKSMVVQGKMRCWP